MKDDYKNIILYMIVPCYNEEDMIQITIDKLTDKIKKLVNKKIITDESRIVLVDDGSSDNTWKVIKANIRNKYIKGLKFSKNCGHQAAVLAGLEYSLNKCNITISIDADLQQDIDAIENFIEKYNQGNDIVYGVRNSRNTDGFFKKITSQIFYDLMAKLGCKSIKNHADYRLVSNRVLNELIKYTEHGVFLRGLFPSIGFKSDIIYFDVFDRSAGSSKYTLKKMINLAFDGITSSSIAPLEYIFGFGIIIFVISILMMISYIFLHIKFILYFGSMLFSSSLVIISLGLVAIYIGKIHVETQNRPRYIIEEYINE